MSLLEQVEIVEGRIRTDDRGRLHVVLSASQLPSGTPFGELYLVFSERPGDRRGDHKHLVADEWFAVVEGAATLELHDPTTGETREIVLAASVAETVLVPAGLAHCLVNRGPGRMIAVAWSTVEYDPEDTLPTPQVS
jgi:oxalate decarboxylase/phosphoglucose isomerase-like protein (cupin superfamily)